LAGQTTFWGFGGVDNLWITFSRMWITYVDNLCISALLMWITSPLMWITFFWCCRPTDIRGGWRLTFGLLDGHLRGLSIIPLMACFVARTDRFLLALTMILTAGVENAAAQNVVL